MLNPETRLNDIVGQVGKTAGLVWDYLAKNGRCSVTDLQNKTKTDYETLNQALGWLARENKIHLTKEAKTTNVWLTDDERRIHLSAVSSAQAGKQRADYKMPVSEARL